MMGSAAFLAPEICTSPSSGRPPRMRSLSTGAPLLRRQRSHRQRMDLLAHAIPEGPVHELVALHAVLTSKIGRDDQRLEMLAVTDHLQVIAGQPGGDALLDAVGGNHSVPELVAGFQKPESERGYGEEEARDYREARARREIGHPEDAIAEAIHHIEERVGVRQALPEGRQRMDRIEHAREEREGHDDEILERGQLVDPVGQNARYQAKRAEETRAAQPAR